MPHKHNRYRAKKGDFLNCYNLWQALATVEPNFVFVLINQGFNIFQ